MRGNFRLISLRKLIYTAAAAPAPPPSEQCHVPAVDIMGSYRDAMVAFGENAKRAVPAALGDMQRNLLELNKSLSAPPEGAVTSRARERLREELTAWSDRAVRLQEENEREIKEIMSGVTRAAEIIGKRDEKYGREISDITTRFRSIAGLNELAPIRRSIVETTTALQTCMERMADENRMAMSDLSAQVEHYRTRLAEVEESAALDPLTGVANRRSFERYLERCLQSAMPFSLMMLDLNDFKAVNDRFGHTAGDSLLTQFAADLRSQFRSTDFVGRWGGDEFVVIMAGGLVEAELRADRVRQWAMGEYTLDAGGRKVKTHVSACIGVVEWDKRETGLELLDRADKKLYVSKSSKTPSPLTTA